MLAEQVAQQTAQGDQAIQDILSQPVVSGQLQIFFGQLFRPPALGVLAGGQQLFLTALQDLTDALEQGDVRVGQPGVTKLKKSINFADKAVNNLYFLCPASVYLFHRFMDKDFFNQCV